MVWTGMFCLAATAHAGSSAPGWVKVVFPSLGGAVLIFLIWAAVFGSRKVRRDQVAVQAWATKNSLHFSAADGFDLVKRFSNFWKIMKPQGFTGQAKNLCWGQVGTGDAILFDLYGGSGRKDGWFYACCSCELPRPVAGMTIRHRGCLDTLGRWFGYHEIQFESAEFNRVWMVESDDHQAVFEVITPQMMEFIMGSKIVCLMTSDNRAMAVMLGTLDPERCEQLLAQVQGFARQLSVENVGEPGGQPVG